MPRLVGDHLPVADGVQRHPQILYDTFDWPTSYGKDRDEHVFILGPRNDEGGDQSFKTNIQTPGFLAPDQTFVITEFDIGHYQDSGDILSLYLGDKPQISAYIETFRRRVLPAPIIVPIRQIVSARIRTRGTYGNARLDIIGYAVRDVC